MRRCNEYAYAMCPDRHICGSLEDAVFADNSECAAHNDAHSADTMFAAGFYYNGVALPPIPRIVPSSERRHAFPEPVPWEIMG